MASIETKKTFILTMSYEEAVSLDSLIWHTHRDNYYHLNLSNDQIKHINDIWKLLPSG